MARSSASNRLLVKNIPYAIKTGSASAGGITVANHASLNPTAAVTLEAWFYVEQFNLGTNLLFDNSDSGATFSYYLDFSNQGSIRWFSTINGSSQNILGTATKIQARTWNFINATFTGSAIYLYLNGVKLPEEKTGLSGSLGTNPGTLRIGRNYLATTLYCLIGNIYRPRVYNVGCSLAEHQARFYRNITSSALQAGLVLDLAMIEGSGSSIADVSGLGNTGTIVSPSTWDNAQVPSKSRSAVSGRVVVSGRVAA